MKRGTPGHPKMDELCGLLGIQRYAAVGIVNTLWDWAQQYVQQGDIGKYSDKVIAKKLDWEGDPAALIAGLVAAKWVDEHPQHRLVIHDWPEHCEDYIHAQLARQAVLFADGSRPKLNKLPKDERPIVEEQYRRHEEEQKRAAQKSAEMRCAAENGSLPCLALPSLADANPVPVREEQTPAAVPGLSLVKPAGQVKTSPPDDWDTPDVSEIARALATELHKSHPVLCDLPTAIRAAEMELVKYPDPQRTADSMRRTHTRHVAMWKAEMTRRRNVFVYHLHKWFIDGVYLQNGVESAEAKPASSAKGSYLREEADRLEREEAQRRAS